MTNKQRHLLWGSAYFALLLVYSAASFYVWLDPPGSDAGWFVSEYGADGYGEFRVDGIAPHGPAQALRPGDKVIAVNGVNVAEHPSAIFAETLLPPHSRYAMTVERNGQAMTFAWQTMPPQRGALPWDKWIPLLFWLTGLIVLLLKAEDGQAWLLALMLGSFSTVLDTHWQEAIATRWFALPVAFAQIGGLFSAPLLFHLFLYFPQPSPWLRRWPQLTRWLYAPFCLFVLPTGGVMRLPFAWAASIGSWPPMSWLWKHGLLLASNLTLVGYLLAALVCFWLSYRTADVAGRRRLRVVMWGSLIGFSSLLLVLAIDAANMQDQWRSIRNWLWSSMRWTLPLVPLSFAYAIVRHRVIPISLIIRRGVRYLLVSHGATLLVMAGLGLLMHFSMGVLFRYWSPTSRVIGMVSALAAIVFWQTARGFHQRVIAPAIDRRFFRQAYDAQQIVAELSASLRTTTEIPQLLAVVAGQLQAALQTESVTIFLRDERTGDYASAYGCVYDAAASRAVAQSAHQLLPKHSATVAQLANTGEPLELDGAEPAFALNGHSLLTAEERQTLLTMKAALLLPLKTKDALPGVVALGSRLGDLPFSGEDKRLLQSVGASAALALDNAQLVERMLAEARRRQEIEAENELRAKELEEARQLQLSMLPMKVPNLPHVEIAAYMKTATEVGGDYYDFHLGADGALTIAIGDATGHGLKAGTMVTATKGLFNHLAGQADLVAMLTQTSRALKRMNLRSLFMAMTLLRLRGDQLQCSVAGMPPVLIYRAATQTVEEVPLRGAPLGGLSNYPYRQAEVRLCAGDVVLLLSDGLPERFNPAGDMFGYERTKASLCANAQAAPSAIIERLLQASEEWASQQAADDDMTFVVLKMKAASQS